MYMCSAYIFTNELRDTCVFRLNIDAMRSSHAMSARLYESHICAVLETMLKDCHFATVTKEHGNSEMA